MTTATSYPTIFSESTCVRKGVCPITTIKGQQSNPLESHSLYFEQHGTGPDKVVLIMGLNSTSFSWGKQVDLLSKDHSILVFDNRGVGNSDTPRGPYTTAAMADDVIELLDYIQWTGQERDLHIVGVSLGGMVAQELATRIPDRILSLTLTVTTAGGNPLYNLPPWKGFTSLLRLVFISDPEVKVSIIVDMLFPQAWLQKKRDGDESGRTNREYQTEEFLRRIKITRPQKLTGHLSQMFAGLTHHVPRERLHAIASAIPKITIVTGDEDNLVRPINSTALKECMPRAELLNWVGTGHAIHAQWPERYCDLVSRTIKESKQSVSI